MNESTKYTGPWIVGMLTADGDRIVRVDDGVVTGWQDMEATSWHVSSMVGEIMAPDWRDPATVGALSGVVRSLYNEPRLSAIYIDWTPLSDDKGWTLGWYEFHSGCGALVFVTCLGRMDPAPTEADAWLAAYHAHQDAAGLTANDIEVIRG